MGMLLKLNYPPESINKCGKRMWSGFVWYVLQDLICKYDEMGGTIPMLEIDLKFGKLEKIRLIWFNQILLNI